VIIRIRKLRKEFPGANNVSTVAVNDLSLDLYPNQIFALLGHNVMNLSLFIYNLFILISSYL